jgi:hypothetical protein
MKQKINQQVLIEKDQLKDIAWAKKQKKKKSVNQPKPEGPAQKRRQK